MITFNEEDVNARLKERRLVKEWIRQVAAGYRYRLGDLNYIFCSDQKILEVNKEYLQHDYYTDIITFDYVENRVLSGDMFISVETVESNSELYDEQKSYQRELHRVIIHGVLHLCGIKDKTEPDAAKMRAAEEKALKLWDKLQKQNEKQKKEAAAKKTV